MAIAKMELLEIEFPATKYDQILMKLIHLDNFHPEYASKFVDSVQGLSVLNRENPYADFISRIEEANDQYQLDLTVQDVEDTKMNIIQADTFFCNILEEVKRIEEVKVNLTKMISENEALISQLEYLNESDLDFDKLFSCQYLKIRFGRLPTRQLDQLQYYGRQEFLFKIFNKGQKDTYCCYIATGTKITEIDNIFSSLYFEEIQIPSFVHGTPETALITLKEENQTAKEYVNDLQGRLDLLFKNNKSELERIYSISKVLNEAYDAQKYVVVFGQNAAIYGFAENDDLEKIKKEFEDEDVQVNSKPATGDSRLIPPTKLRSNWFCRPFKMFVEMYGVPSYTDFDPTNYVAISYTFLFGMMFGDLGQGLLLSIVGYIAYKWKGMALGEVGMRIGISSAFFGIIYGSVFGNEEILKPIFHVMASESVMPLLGIAIGIGVGLIIISIIFNILLNFKKKNLGEMWFSQNGIAGLIFYVSVLFFVVDKLMGITLPINENFYEIVFIGIPVILIFLREPLENKLLGEKMFPHGFGGFFTEAFFELFDVALTFIANTMSFLRVGGFVLSHAGMMLVVYTLANMIGGVGYWIVLIFGNIFVMVLEGMIVGIQVLRLEFYEMFSRYYDGKGVLFRTIKER